MKLDTVGADLIKSFERCELTAYPDSGGRWTIGWGHTNGVQKGDTCSQAQADAWFLMDFAEMEREVSELVTVPLTQNQFNALVSFDYNCGFVNLKASSLLKYLNQRKYQMAASEFLKWNRAGGVIITGLVRRRKAEMDLFNTP
jgi:lysozyme